MSKSKLNKPQKENQNQNQNQSQKKPNYQPRYQRTEAATPLLVALFYCLLVLVLPVGTFFTTKYLLFDSVLELSIVQQNIYSAVAAVIALHIALGLYLYRAYGESVEADRHPPQKVD